VRVYLAVWDAMVAFGEVDMKKKPHLRPHEIRAMEKSAQQAMQAAETAAKPAPMSAPPDRSHNGKHGHGHRK
jgi:hypothetical protein